MAGEPDGLLTELELLACKMERYPYGEVTPDEVAEGVQTLAEVLFALLAAKNR